MSSYSIKELERLSGIKAHTIRIWEKRYKIISPQRTSSNVRLYSDDELKRIINVATLNNSGIKISRVASLSTDEINKAITEISQTGLSGPYIDQLVVSMIDLDEESFERILSGATGEFGFEKTVMEIVYAFLERIGVLWQTGSITPAHEHFISNLVRQHLIKGVASLSIPSKKARKAVLFLPEGELHELGLLFYHYLARSRGLRTIYLGQSVPHKDLVSVCRIHQADVLITAFTSSLTGSELERYINRLSTDFPSLTILASGLQVRRTAFRVPVNVKPFYKASELAGLIDHLA